MEITFLEYNDFIAKNPIVQWNIDFVKNVYNYDVRVLTLEKDLKDMIKYCPQCQWALDNKKPSYVFDQLRLLLGMEEDLNYMDLDAHYKIGNIKPNSICLEGDGHINNGSWSVTKKDANFCKHYYEMYNQHPEDYELVNYEFNAKYMVKGHDTKLVYGVEGTHYYLSMFSRLKKRHIGSTLCYTMFYDRAMREILKGNDVLWMNTRIGDIYYQNMGATLYQYHILPMDVLEAQFKSIGIKLINLDC